MQKSNGEIELLANKIRERLGVSQLLAPDLVQIVLSRASVLVPSFNLNRVFEEELPEGVEADANTETGELRISEGVWQKLKAGCPRSRFTVAHELAHFFLNHNGTLRRDKYMRRTDAATIVQENEANVFASYFLVPTALAKESKTPSEISTKFQISLSAAEVRLRSMHADIHRMENRSRPLPKRVVSFMKNSELNTGYHFNSLPDEERE